MDTDILRIIIVADNTNWGYTKGCLESLAIDVTKFYQSALNRVLAFDILIVNNGTPLIKQELPENYYSYYIDNSAPETYGAAIYKALCSSGFDSDVVLIEPGIRCDKSAIITLYVAANTNPKVGILSAGHHPKQVITPTKGIVYVKQSAIDKRIDNRKEFFNKKLMTVEAVLLNAAIKALQRNLITFEIAIIYNYLVDSRHKDEKAEEHDRAILEERWGMKYFNTEPNLNIVSCIKESKDKEFNVFEFGYDMGATLVEIKNRFPNACINGIEQNFNAFTLSEWIFDYECGFDNGDIDSLDEDYFKSFGNKVDYIIFGDVLEHLRNPEEVIKNCKYMLKDGGKIIASIPNLMHISVIKELLNGRFEYTDRGLLDRTHIHFFTKKEIGAMFYNAGYDVNITSLETAVSRDDMNLISALMKLGMATRSEYTTFQYLCVATPKQ